MAVRSKRLALHRGGTTVNTLVDIYTCGPDETTLIKDMIVYYRQTVAGQVRVAIDTVDDPATNFFAHSFTAQNEWEHWQGFLVLHPGDKIQVLQTQINAATVILSGAELEGVAD